MAERVADSHALRIPVLTYHSLDHGRTPISTTPAHFARQMAALHLNGWRTVGAGEMLEGLARGAWPAKTFVLTFDDGYMNFCEQALPVLLPLGFTAVVFVVGARVGGSSDWSGQPKAVPSLPLMDWDTLRLIAGQGMMLGAHTLTHPHLPALSALEAEREVLESRRMISERTEREVAVFAYPYGEATPELEAMVGRHFRAGFGTRLAFCTRSSRAMQLERIDMYYLQGMAAGLAESRSWLRPYLAFRRALRQVRGRMFSQPDSHMPRARATCP